MALNRQDATALTPDEVRRYSRHLLLPQFGVRRQKKLKSARVLLVGLGGLGSPAALYLAAAGVGTLGLVDFDEVAVSNLQRQVLHATSDVGRAKVDSAMDRLGSLNPTITLVPHRERLSSGNALALIANYDVVLDGTDTFATRYLINDACVLAKKPNVSASVFGFEGQVSVFCTKDGPCYRCLYAEPPPPGLVPSCGEGGVLGVVPGVIGTLQATEALKLLGDFGEPLIGRLLAFDALEMRFSQFKLKRRVDCEVCGSAPSITALEGYDYPAFCGLQLPDVPEVSPEWLKGRLGQVLLLDVRESGEREIQEWPGALTIPYAQLEERFHELPANGDVVVFCRVGERSARAVSLLLRLGVSGAVNLAGGLDRWNDEA